MHTDKQVLQDERASGASGPKNETTNSPKNETTDSATTEHGVHPTRDPGDLGDRFRVLEGRRSTDRVDDGGLIATQFIAFGVSHRRAASERLSFLV